MSRQSVVNAVISLINTQGPSLASSAQNANTFPVQAPTIDAMPAVLVRRMPDRKPERWVTSGYRLRAWRVDTHAWKAYQHNPPTEGDEDDWQTFSEQLESVFRNNLMLAGQADVPGVSSVVLDDGGGQWQSDDSAYWTMGGATVVRHQVIKYDVTEYVVGRV